MTDHEAHVHHAMKHGGIDPDRLAEALRRELAEVRFGFDPTPTKAPNRLKHGVGVMALALGVLAAAVPGLLIFAFDGYPSTAAKYTAWSLTAIMYSTLLIPVGLSWKADR